MKINDSNGFDPDYWGPCAWQFLHTISFNYPLKPSPEEKRYYKKFIESLSFVLPCGYCRKNMKRHLKELGFSERHLESRLSFSYFVYSLHRKVNRELNKENISFEKVREKYERIKRKSIIPVIKLKPI